MRSSWALRWCPKILRASDADKAAFHPSVYVGIQPDGQVIIVVHRSEMGTGIRTSLPMVLADELEADWKRVRIEQAIGDRKYGSQNTDGSISIRLFLRSIPQAGATARMMLEARGRRDMERAGVGMPGEESRGSSRENRAQARVRRTGRDWRRSNRSPRKKICTSSHRPTIAISAKTCPASIWMQS